MCVGLAPRRRDDPLAPPPAPGNVARAARRPTGRDGIGGACVLASAELERGRRAKRPSVQIGDPFEESKLLECCLELLERELLVALQDLGAAGLTSSAGEMASKGGVGLDIDVVAGAAARGRTWSRSRSWSPSRRSGCSCVVEPAQLDAVLALCEQLADRRHRDRRGHRHAAPAGARRRRRWSATCRSPRWWTSARCTTWSPRSPAAGSTRTRRPREPSPSARPSATRATLGGPAGAARLAQRRLAALGLRAVRLDGRLAHDATARAGRRRGADAARERTARDRGLDRRQRPPRRLRPVRRRGRGGARVRRRTSPASAPSRSD